MCSDILLYLLLHKIYLYEEGIYKIIKDMVETPKFKIGDYFIFSKSPNYKYQIINIRRLPMNIIPTDKTKSAVRYQYSYKSEHLYRLKMVSNFYDFFISSSYIRPTSPP